MGPPGVAHCAALASPLALSAGSASALDGPIEAVQATELCVPSQIARAMTSPPAFGGRRRTC